MRKLSVSRVSAWRYLEHFVREGRVRSPSATQVAAGRSDATYCRVSASDFTADQGTPSPRSGPPLGTPPAGRLASSAECTRALGQLASCQRAAS